jgi:metal-responsive CopG/Arc/MetJ family transcriptional regulator
MKRTVVWLTERQARALGRISEKSFAPVSALVRQAVKEFLQRKRKSGPRKSLNTESQAINGKD